MGDIGLSIGGIGGIGGIGPGTAVTLQINPIGTQASTAPAPTNAAANAASVIVNLSDAAWRALAADAATVVGTAPLSSKVLEDLAAAALLAILLADRQQDTPAAAAIKMYLLVQALRDL